MHPRGHLWKTILLRGIAKHKERSRELQRRMMFAYLIKYSIIFDTPLIYLISFHWINRKKGSQRGAKRAGRQKIFIYWSLLAALEFNCVLCKFMSGLMNLWASSFVLHCTLEKKNVEKLFKIRNTSRWLLSIFFMLLIEKRAWQNREKESCLPQIPLNRWTCKAKWNIRHDFVKVRERGSRRDVEKLTLKEHQTKWWCQS